MRHFIYSLLVLTLFVGCKKEHGSRVDIYLLDSFSVNTTVTSGIHSTSISNAVLASAPLVADNDIKSYNRSASVFTLRKNIKPIIQNYRPDKAFAVTVDGEPIYYGRFHPAYLSSITVGLATIDPIMFASETQLPIQFVSVPGTQDDKRNDPRILDALRATGRLK